MRPIKITINQIPDNVLLNIFTFLDEETLETASLVCRRWFFLANTVELWIFKCKTLGEKENLLEIESILLSELSNDEDIDWKLAYTELKEFVNELKRKYKDKLDALGEHIKNDTLNLI